MQSSVADVYHHSYERRLKITYQASGALLLARQRRVRTSSEKAKETKGNEESNFEKWEIWKLNLQTWNFKVETWNLKLRKLRSSNFQTWNLKLRSMKVRNLELESSNWNCKLRKLSLQTASLQTGIRRSKIESSNFDLQTWKLKLRESEKSESWVFKLRNPEV